MKSKKIYIPLIAFLLLVIFLALGIYTLTDYIYEKPSVNKDVTLEVKKGEGLKAISLKLKEKGVIENEHLFILYVMYEGFQDDLKAGEYEFKSGSTISDVAEKLVSGDIIVYRVTIPEGLTAAEIGELLQDQDVVLKDEFLELLINEEFRSELLGEKSMGFEGYLFPDTYSYNKDVTAKDLITMMVSRFGKVFGGLQIDRTNSGLTDHEIIILASIIEKETGTPQERALVSAVFHNRMRIGMKLDSDPTVIYGLGEEFDGRLTRRDLKQLTDYNTYMIKGLPPGPIANPGRDSIVAALNPAEVDYLYFVSKGDGSGEHNFSTNYSDHRRAVSEYRKRVKP